MLSKTLTGNHARDYQRYRFRSWDQAWVNWREQRLVAKLLMDCELAGSTVLDIPCGYGRFFPLLTRLGITVTNADVDPDMVRLATQQPSLSSPRRGVCANILALPFADQSVDAVLCVRLFHHRFCKAERLQMLRELARVSRRFVLISFYRLTPVHALARHWRGSRGRLQMLSLLQIQNLALASGLHIHQVRSLLRFCHAQTLVVLRKWDPSHARVTQPQQVESLLDCDPYLP